MEAPATESWARLQAHMFEAQSLYYSAQADGRWLGLQAMLQGLGALLGDLWVAYQCPLACTRLFRTACDWSLALGHPLRARSLLQMGNIFKLQAMARWWNALTPGDGTQNRRYEPRLQVEYTIAVTQLHASLQVPVRPLRRRVGQSFGVSPLRVEIHSICTYRPDETSNTGPVCPLPDLSVPNHRAYAAKHGHQYVLHTTLRLPNKEAHYSKMLVIREALQSADGPEWVFFIDCDAFFTNADVAIGDVLESYGAGGTGGPNFLVAEDPGGINTGTMLFRRSAWSIAFLDRVAASQFSIAWDQSMFFWEMLRPGLLELQQVNRFGVEDFKLPPEVALVHQAHLNAFVPPASRDWSAYEWQPGDFVRHFAGCPWQEAHCLGLMRETVALAGF